MVEKKSKIWENISMPQLVKSIADQYRLSYAVPNDHFVWDRVLQNDQSNWETLVSSCNSLGYFVTANGTHIHVYDPYKALLRGLPYVELKSVKGSSGVVSYAPGNILELNGTFGEYTPDGHASTFKYVGIDNSGNLISTETVEDDIDYSGLGEKVVSKYVNTVTRDVTSLEMLKRFAGAEIRKRYPYNVSVYTTGIAEPMPGSIAKIDNYDSYFDGYWLVRSIKHQVSRSNYVTKLSLSTDATSKAPPIRRPVAAFKQPPEPVIDVDTWVAKSSLEDLYVG
jgi:phage protein D